MIRPGMRNSVNLNEASKLTGIKSDTLKRQIKNGYLLAYQEGPKMYRIFLNDLEEYLYNLCLFNPRHIIHYDIMQYLQNVQKFVRC